MKNTITGIIIMLSKLTLYGFIVQCLTLTILVAGESKAQKTVSISKMEVPVLVKSGTTSQYFKMIEANSAYHFAYDGKDLNASLNIKLENDDNKATVKDILKEVSRQTALSFKQINNTIYVNKTEESEVVETVVETLAPIDVSGHVSDSEGNPLPGVNILVKNANSGTITNADGSFNLSVPDENDTLVFSFIGYNSEEVAVNGRSTIDVVLLEDIQSLNEIVVVGYGSQEKENLTGAVSPIDGEEITWKPVGQTSTALQGVAPGVTVTQRSGQPGGDQGTIRIRGIGTFNDNAPLVLVDGVQYDINDVDPNDIESMSVLKDAAAASIYGVRAANGVILITTKRGAEGKPQISYNNYFGWQAPTRLPNFVGAPQFMQLVNQMNTNSGGGNIYSESDIAAYNNPDRNPDQYADNYWFDDVLTGSGFQQSHSLAISGGAENVKYRFSTNYFDQQGLVQGMDFDRLTVRLNTDIKVTERLSFNADISAKISDQKEPQGEEGSVWYQFGQAAVINPLAVNRYSDGRWAPVRGSQNPIRLQEEGGLYNYQENLYTGNFRADYDIIEGLKLSGLASINNSSEYNSMHNRAFTYITNDGNVTFGQNDIDKSSVDFWFTNLQGLLTYEKEIGKHSFNVLAGVSRLTQRTDNLGGYRRDLPNGSLSQINAGAAEGQEATGSAYEYALQSYFGRINYAFNDKYLLEANIRHDGSSRFAEGQKWGTFPSFSAGWRISQEGFMQNVGVIEELKLRASWGRLGNDNTLDTGGGLDYYPYQSTIAFNSYTFGNSLNQTAGLTTYPNTALSWETTEMTDIGLDLVLMSGKIDATFDYYIKNTNDILLQLAIPSTVGLNAAFQNAGSMRNEGWELAVNYNGEIGDDFSYRVGGNIADVRNEVTDMRGSDYLSTDNNNIVTAYQTGDPLGAFYGYQVDGLFQTQEEVDGHATQAGNTAPGDLIYRDINDDGNINADDRVYLGNNIPRFTYGINLGATYQNLSLSAFFQGVGQVDIHTLPILEAPTSTDGNFREIHQDSWTEANPGASFPRLTTGTQNYQSSSYWIRSGAYLRLKSVKLNYRLPTTWIEPIGLSTCSVFVSGQNLLTFTNLNEGIDPEAPNDTRYYPQVKIYTFGINVNF